MNLKQFNFKAYIPVRFADLDVSGHVSNATCLTYFEIARCNYWREVINWNWEEMGIVVARAEIDYISPVKLYDEVFVYVRTSRTGNTSFDLEYVLTVKRGNEDTVCATGKTVCVAFDYDQNKPAPIPDHQLVRMKSFEFLCNT
ncbi:acyl-CoA thioesterase [Pedobacter sp. BS3]|uniref:acyl-CoA thioesterase n=1 Tax=Pedobacter sp. BS3 TaxID=2567937 RepID=UPI0011F024AA|nr:thioesterase family protein [Pedobacter sp. BS3]TZF83601.1 acyl-CoA thioesterase [Pedobacter sp. BS3]